MVLFVIYIDRGMNNLLSGVQIEQTYLKCLAYAGDFVALNDNECDKIFELIRKFCSESDTAINLQKF
jgi:hypothetical protein